MVDKVYREAVVVVRRFGDRILSITLALEPEIVHIIYVYTPQAGLDDEIKKKLWYSLGDVLSKIPRAEKIFLGGDLNGHVGKDRVGYEMVHGGQGFGAQNKHVVFILYFVLASDTGTVNTFYKKIDNHLVTFRSRHNVSQID